MSREMVDASHDDVRCLFDSGWTLQKEGRIDDAIACFTRVLDMEPDFVKASYARGACFNIKGEYAKAIGATHGRRAACSARMTGRR